MRSPKETGRWEKYWDSLPSWARAAIITGEITLVALFLAACANKSGAVTPTAPLSDVGPTQPAAGQIMDPLETARPIVTTPPEQSPTTVVIPSPTPRPDTCFLQPGGELVYVSASEHSIPAQYSYIDKQLNQWTAAEKKIGDGGQTVYEQVQQLVNNNKWVKDNKLQLAGVGIGQGCGFGTVWRNQDNKLVWATVGQGADEKLAGDPGGFGVGTGLIVLPDAGISGKVELLVGKDRQLVITQGDRNQIIKAFDQNTREWIQVQEGIKLTEADFLKLTIEQRQEMWNTVPAKEDGFAKSNFSTILNYLIIYRDENGNAREVLNLLNNEKSNLPDAGIVEFGLGTEFHPEWYGKKGELRAFALDIPGDANEKAVEESEIRAVEKMLEFMVEDGVKWGDFSQAKAGDIPEGYKYPHINIAWYIPDKTHLGGFAVKSDKRTQDAFFYIYYSTVEYEGKEGVIVEYKSPESEYGVNDKSVFIAMRGDRFYELLTGDKVNVPPKP